MFHWVWYNLLVILVIHTAFNKENVLWITEKLNNYLLIHSVLSTIFISTELKWEGRVPEVIPIEVIQPQLRGLCALLYSNSAWVLLRPAELWTMKSCEMGPMVYHPCLRRLESLTICQCYYYKGSTFYSNPECWSSQGSNPGLKITAA